MGNSLDRFRSGDAKPEEPVTVADVEQDVEKSEVSIDISDLEQGSKPESVAEITEVEQEKEEEEGLTLKAIADKLRNQLSLWSSKIKNIPNMKNSDAVNNE